TNNVTPSVIVTSLLYVSRYCQRLASYGLLSPPNAEIQVWTTALMLADVSLNDAAYAVKSWAQVTSIPTDECIRMRKKFLEMIKYDLQVTELQYATWISALQQISALVASVLQVKFPVYQLSSQ